MCVTKASKPRVVLLPGMGTDARLFAPQRAALPRLEVPDWIDPASGESLANYARRWAATVDPEPPMVLGGVSFGGMVALAAAQHLRPQALVLISTCRSGRAVTPALALAARMGRMIPIWALGCMRGLLTRGFAWLDGLAEGERNLLTQLIADSSPAFLRWAVSAVVGWEHDSQSLPQELVVRQVHGGRDRVISPKRSGADVIIPTGGHLINLTHADEVNEVIRSVL